MSESAPVTAALGGVAAEATASEPPREAAATRFLSIDVLRAIAALLVVVAHLLQCFFPDVFARQSVIWITLAQAGVGLFFVLSGFCIHLPVARRERNGSPALVRYPQFFKRRFVRLYPVHLAGLLLSALVAMKLRAHPSFVPLVTWPTRTQLVLHLFMAHTFSSSAFFSVNSVLWTLAIETHFYLLYPVFLVLRRRLDTSRVVLGAFLLSVLLKIVLYHFGHDVNDAWDLWSANALARWWEWLLGCLMAEWGMSDSEPVSWERPAFVLAIAVALGVVLTRAGYWWVQSLLWPFLFADTILSAVRVSGGPPGLWLKGVATAGLMSYSIYLTHPIAFFSAEVVLSAGSPAWVLTLAPLVLTCLLSTTFYVLLEKPLAERARGIGVFAPAVSLS